MFFDEFQQQKDKVQRPDKQKSLKLNSFFEEVSFGSEGQTVLFIHIQYSYHL